MKDLGIVKNWTQTEFLLDMLEYYTQDTNRRCVKSNGRCTYNPINADKQGISEGCAIGRWMTPEHQNRGDLNFCIAADLPKETISNLLHLDVIFLTACQSLHDHREYWGDNELSFSGTQKLKNLIVTYNLDEKVFAKYL